LALLWRLGGQARYLKRGIIPSSPFARKGNQTKEKKEEFGNWDQTIVWCRWLLVGRESSIYGMESRRMQVAVDVRGAL